MKLKIIAFVVLISAVSCVSNDEKRSTTVSAVAAQSESSIKDTALYLRVGDPDTALAIFVFRDCYNYDYDLERESYIRWDLEYDKLLPLVNALFQKRNDFGARMKQITDNRVKFLADARKVVVSDAHEYNGISDTMEFQYLVERKDSLLKDLIPEMLKNPKVGEGEKKLLEETLRKL